MLAGILASSAPVRPDPISYSRKFDTVIAMSGLPTNGSRCTQGLSFFGVNQRDPHYRSIEGSHRGRVASTAQVEVRNEGPKDMSSQNLGPLCNGDAFAYGK